MNISQAALNNKLKSIGGKKVKLLAVKRFNKIQIKLKGYFIQILLKLRYKGPKIVILVDAVIYTGIFLIGKALE